jgi:hypothetical protein
MLALQLLIILGKALELNFQKDYFRKDFPAELSNIPSCYTDLPAHQTQRFSRNVQTGSGAHTAYCSAGTVILPGDKAAEA